MMRPIILNRRSGVLFLRSQPLIHLQARHQNQKIRNCSSLGTSTSWDTTADKANRPAWSEEWKQSNLGAELVNTPTFPPHLFFVQIGFGVDQHGKDDATKASIRAVRNAIEFNSIPGVIRNLPGGRNAMLIHVKLGIPHANTTATTNSADERAASTLFPVDLLQVAKVFPYGKLLPIEVCVGGLSFHTGRIVEELGDTDDRAICVAACISVGYTDDDGKHPNTNKDETPESTLHHETLNSKDGY